MRKPGLRHGRARPRAQPGASPPGSHTSTPWRASRRPGRSARAGDPAGGAGEKRRPGAAHAGPGALHTAARPARGARARTGTPATTAHPGKESGLPPAAPGPVRYRHSQDGPGPVHQLAATGDVARHAGAECFAERAHGLQGAAGIISDASGRPAGGQVARPLTSNCHRRALWCPGPWKSRSNIGSQGSGMQVTHASHSEPCPRRRRERGRRSARKRAGMLRHYRHHNADRRHSGYIRPMRRRESGCR